MAKCHVYKWLKIEDIRTPEFRRNSRFENNGDFEESIKVDGVIYPIYVFKNDKGVYWLSDGQKDLKLPRNKIGR
ncbi:MAG: ParB/Srx family N-terminal domain-containing protein [Candidatus Bathyarchaeia archaeon]